MIDRSSLTTTLGFGAACCFYLLAAVFFLHGMQGFALCFIALGGGVSSAMFTLLRKQRRRMAKDPSILRRF